LIVKEYPKGTFYAYKDEDGTYWNYDVLCREAEIISGGRRIDDHDQLVESIEAAGMNPDDFSEYLSIFKYGMPPHGGFGMGFERFTMLALGLENIRQATLFPSDPSRVASQKLPESNISGAEQIKKSIKQLFVEADLEFSVIKHKPTPTSEDSANVRDMKLSEGIKALILREKKTGNNIMVSVPADKKVNIKSVESFYAKAHKLKSAKFEFEKPELISKKFGLEVGGVPPLGYVFGLETYFDESVFSEEQAGFNNCDQEESLITTSQNILTLIEGQAEVGDFSQ
jgi:nondiscriminating aspartyl-tRNA synthetase